MRQSLHAPCPLYLGLVPWRTFKARDASACSNGVTPRPASNHAAKSARTDETGNPYLESIAQKQPLCFRHSACIRSSPLETCHEARAMPRGPSTFSFSFFPVPSNVLSVLTFVHLILFFAVAATHTGA